MAAPVALCRYPPMYDLPCHEEIVSAMQHFGDRARYPPGLLAWNLGHPNQLFYFLALALTLVAPATVACKFVVVASVAAVPLAGARLANHLGVSRWATLTVAPLGLGFYFFFGMVGNLLALSLLIACLPQLDTFVRTPTLRGVGAVTLTLSLLYAAHESGLMIACLAMVILALGHAATPRQLVMKATPVAAGVCAMLGEQWRATRHLSPELRNLPATFDLAFWQKRDGLPQALLGLHGSRTTLFPFFWMVSAIAMLALQGLQQRGWLRPDVWRAFPSRRVAARAHLRDNRFAWLGVVLVVLYFAFPFSVQGAMWLHARFLAPGVAVLVVALAPSLPATPWVLARAASIGAMGAVLAMLRPEFAATGALYSDLETLLPKIELGSAVAGIDLFGGQWRHLVFSVGGAAARASSERGGRMAVSFTQATPLPPVVIAPGHRWDDSFARMSPTSSGFKPAFDLHRFRYVLSWTPTGRADDLTRALSPEARLVAKSGAWVLYESTIPLEPLLSIEPASGAEESLKRRLEEVHAASGQGP